jgi:signal transduction histidine kinase
MRLSRLLPRIYIVSLLQLLAIVGGVMLVAWLSFNPERGPEFERRGRYVADTLAEVVGDQAALARELTRAKEQMRLSVSVYSADGSLIGSNVEPPLAAPSSEHKRPTHPPPPLGFFWRPPRAEPILRLPLVSARLPGAYVVYRPPPPPSPRDPGLWLLGISLMATAVASILLARSFARPLSQLAAAAKRFGTGDLHARAGLTRKDEFGELSQAFDEMAERVMQLVRSRQELLANVSHELRTPLASLVGFIETLQGPARDDPAGRERFLDIMRDQAWRMTRLIDDLLSLSRIELREHVAPNRPVDLRLVTMQMIDTLRPMARERNVEIALDCSPEPVLVLGHEDELSRVVENLVENAVKYGESGKRVEVALARRGAEIELLVRDYGPGIAHEHLPRLTERFYRVNVAESRGKGGTGLGLAIVKHIVGRHRGRLAVESEPGQGATFRVLLPAPA